jgi:proteasome lid subunit RPN8/RPN11
MVSLAAELIAAIVAHSRGVAPEEGCGLLAVDETGVVRHAYCLANVEHSPVRFTIDPDGHFAALQHAEGAGWRIGGDFHSHPRSAAQPSTDIAGHYPER